MVINWTSQKVKDSYATHNPFDFRNVCKFERSVINTPGPCVLFATPGMISGGFSLEVFKQWAPHEGNLVTLPGYCVAGTVGHRLMSAKTPTLVNIDQNTQIAVRCQIHQLSFSPHTDAKGIMDIVKFLSPKHVILVHGEKPKMESLKARIETDFGIQSDLPANNETVNIPSTHYVKADASSTFTRSTWSPNFKFLKTRSRGNSDYMDVIVKPVLQVCRTSSRGDCSSDERVMIAKPMLQICDVRVAEGILTTGRYQNPKVVHLKELVLMSGEESHQLQFALCFPVRIIKMDEKDKVNLVLHEDIPCLHQLFMKLNNEFSEATIQVSDQNIQIESFVVSICSMEKCLHRMNDAPYNISEAVYFCCMWSASDEKLAWKVISFMKNLELSNG